MESMEEEKKMEKPPPNYRTLAQLQEQWERAQELKRHPKQEKEKEEPPPETALPGDGGGDTCPVVKATSDGGVETKKGKGKGKNEGEGRPRGEEGGVEREGKAIAEEVTLEGEVKKRKKKKEKEKSDVESEGEGNPRGERKGGGFRGFKRNWTVEKWVKVVCVEVGESDRAVVKELEIENVVLDSDRRVKVGRAGGLSVRRGRGRGRRVMGNRSDRTVNAEVSEIENLVVDESDQFLDAVKENVGVDERNLTAEVGREMGKLSVRENVRSDGHRGGYNSGGNRTKRQNRRARRGGGVDNHRDQTVKVGFETENVGVEGNVGVEESDQMVEIRTELGEPSVREDGVQEDGRGSGHRGRSGGRNKTKGKNIRAGRGRGGMGYHRDRMVKVENGLEIENVEAERSDQKVENVLEIKDAVGENVGVEKSDRKAEVGPFVRDDEGREDGPSYRHRDHNGGGNMTKWKNERLGRGRSEMSYNRDQMVKVEKELDMEDLGVEESDQTAENVADIKNAVKENLVVECDQTLEDVLEVKDAVEEDVGVESGGTSEVGNWQYERAGQGRGGDRTDYRRGYRWGRYGNGNDRWGYGRSNQRRGQDRNGPVWVRKEDAAAQSKGRVAWEGVKRSVDILS